MNSSTTIKTLPLLTFFFLVTLFSPANAQEITEDQTLEYINSKLADGCQVQTKKLFNVTFSKNGDVFREDRIALEDLDPESMSYNEEEGKLIVRCYDRSGKCIDRSIYKQDLRRGYSRIAFPLKGGVEEAEGIQKALLHLINLEMDDDYSSSEWFE